MQAYLVNRINIARQYLRLAPFDVNSEEGRAAERYRRVAWTLLASIVSKTLAMAAVVLSVGLTMPYLGSERFGIWMTIASFAGMLSFLDLGVGNALINHIAQAAAVEDRKRLRRVVSGGLALLFLLALGFGIILLVAAQFLPWGALIKVKDVTLHGEMQKAVVLFAVLFSINIFTAGVQKVFAGLQRAYEGHLAVASGQLVSIAMLFWAAYQQVGIVGLLAVTFGVQTLAPASLLVVLARRGLIGLEGVGKVIRNESHVLLRTGGLFLLLQIGYMVGWGMDSFIIANMLGASQVAMYSVVQRMFQFVSLPLAMINAPLWSAYADACVRNDGHFIRMTLKKSLVGTAILGVAGSSILFALGPSVVRWWTGGIIDMSFAIAGAMAAWKVLEVTGDALAMFLNGTGVVRPQVWVVLLFCVITLPLKLLFVEDWGVAGLIWITAGAYLLTVWGGYGFVFRNEVVRRFHG